MFQFKPYWQLIIVALLETDTSAQLFKRIKKRFFPLLLLGNCQMKIDSPSLYTGRCGKIVTKMGLIYTSKFIRQNL